MTNDNAVTQLESTAITARNVRRILVRGVNAPLPSEAKTI